MKTNTIVLAASIVATICVIVFLHNMEPSCDHNCQVEKEFAQLKPPIIVVATSCDDFWGCNAMVRDSTGKSLYMGNMSALGKLIGASYHKGDTIK
jgi:hypothetical protein